MDLTYWRRDGTECSETEFLRLYGDVTYRKIAEDVVGGQRIITVWLGHDYEYVMGMHDKPKPFGTLVCDTDGTDGRETRWENEDEARAGHEEIVAGLRR